MSNRLLNLKFIFAAVICCSSIIFIGMKLGMQLKNSPVRHETIFKNPFGITFSNGKAYVVNSSGGYVSVLDSMDGRQEKILMSPEYKFNNIFGVTSNERYIWVRNFDSITQINSLNDSLTRVIKVDNGSFNGKGSIAYCGRSLWFATGKEVLQISENNGQILKRIDLLKDGLTNPWWLTTEGSDVWVSGQGEQSMVKVNCKNGSIIRVIDVGFNGSEGDVEATKDHLWISSLNGIFKLDQNTGMTIKKFTLHRKGFGGGQILVEQNSIWALNDATNMVYRLNRKNGSVRQIFRVKNSVFIPSAIAMSRERIWILGGEGDAVIILDERTGEMISFLGSKSSPLPWVAVDY